MRWKRQDCKIVGSKKQFVLFNNKRLTFIQQTNYYQHMENNRQKQEPNCPLQRLHLEPLSLNIPLPNNSQQTVSLEELMKHRCPVVQSERQNKSTSIKTTLDLKQVLSRSLFNKKQCKRALTTQKLLTEMSGFRSDSKPISPESQQKEPIKSQKQMKGNQIQMFDDVDNECRFSNTEDILDTKFNRILEMGFGSQQQMDLEIQSKFICKKSQKSFKDDDIELLEPCTNFDQVLAHEKLLEEENGFIRDQLIVFTEMLEDERFERGELSHRVKKLQKENSKLRERNKILQEQLLDKQQKCYNLTITNQEFRSQIGILTEGKEDLMKKFQQLSKEFEDICCKLQNYQTIKDKEIEAIVDQKNREKELFSQQISEKQRQITELNDVLEELKLKLTAFEQRSPIKAEKISSSMDQVSEDQEDRDEAENENENENEEIDLKISELKNSSICLSLAEAESLKNIIESKQQEIEHMRTQSFHEQQSSLKIIGQLTSRIQQYQSEKEQKQKGIEKICDIQHLRQIFSKKISALQHYLQEERAQNQRLNNKLSQIENKYQTIEKQQDDELQDLLENCVNELQKERHTNHLLRQEIDNLKRTFKKQLLYVEQIQNNVYLN